MKASLLPVLMTRKHPLSSSIKTAQVVSCVLRLPFSQGTHSRRCLSVFLDLQITLCRQPELDVLEMNEIGSYAFFPLAAS